MSTEIAEVETLLNRALLPGSSAFMNAGWVRSMPESRTAQLISLQFTRKSVRAASALTAGIERTTAVVAVRFNEICEDQSFFASADPCDPDEP